MTNLDYLEILKNAGFHVYKRKTGNTLSPEIQNRYPNIPDDYFHFLNSFKEIVSKDDKVWFVAIEDFNNESDIEFSWNEFETMSLDAYDDDKEELSRIRKFWNKHLPILMSVREYEYLAISLNKDHFGAIVHGAEPEFEEISLVCDSFEQLMELFKNPSANPYLQNFI